MHSEMQRQVLKSMDSVFASKAMCAIVLSLAALIVLQSHRFSLQYALRCCLFLTALNYVVLWGCKNNGAVGETAPILLNVDAHPSAQKVVGDVQQFVKSATPGHNPLTVSQIIKKNMSSIDAPSEYTLNSLFAPSEFKLHT